MVYYIAYYSLQDKNRVRNLAGEDKIDYICDSIIKSGEEVTILSNAKSASKKFLKTEKKQLKMGKNIVLFASLPNINIFIHALDVIWGYVQLIKYIFLHVKEGESILVYHSLGYRNIFKYIRKIKKFNYILEVEELYQYFDSSRSTFKKKEHLVFLEPDAFIFSNNILEKEINLRKCPYIVVNGIYRIENRVITEEHQTIRVVYAGNLEKQKGVDYIIESAMYLPSNYEMKIIGFGSKVDIDRVNNLICKISKISKAKITYDGVFIGEEYKKYLQSCDIGICIQNPEDEFNKFEFPSKIFSYLANGLKVVTNELIQITQSEIANHVCIVSDIKPQKIAEGILKCTNERYDAERVINNLDEKFIQFLKQFISKKEKNYVNE